MVCSIPAIVIPAGEQRIATRNWLALRTHRLTVTTELLDGPDALRITVTGMKPQPFAAALIDGASAAMQRADPASPIIECGAQLAPAVGLSLERVIDLLTRGARTARTGSQARGS